MAHQDHVPFRVSTVTRKASERNSAKPISKQFKVIFMNQAMEISLFSTDFPVSALIPKITSIVDALYPQIQAYLVDIRQTETDKEVASLTEIRAHALYELKIRPEGMTPEEMKEEVDDELINDEVFQRTLTTWKDEMQDYSFKSLQTDPQTHFKDGVIKLIKFERKKGSKRTFKCPFFQCNKFFAQSGNLRTHLRTHTGARPFTCEECNKSFITKGHLNSHQLIHTGDRPFVCPFDGCRKSYSRSGRLKIHMRSHTGEKPYVCTFPNCEKSFTQRGNLKTHLRIHFGEKPHECTVCGKKFVTNGHLKDHFRTHSDEKQARNYGRPYQCTRCDKTYKRISTLHIHMKQSHNIVVKSNKIEVLAVKSEDDEIKRESKYSLKEEEKAARAMKENELSLIKIPLSGVKQNVDMEIERGSPNDGFSSFSKSVCSKIPVNFAQALQLPSMDMPRLSIQSEDPVESPKKPHLTKAQLDLINARRQPTASTPQNLFSIPLDPRMDRSPNATLLNPSTYLGYNFPSLQDPISSLGPLGAFTPKQLELFKGGLTPSNLDLFQGGLTPVNFQKLSDGLNTPHALHLFCGNSSPSPNLLGRYPLSNSLLKQQHQQNLETVRNLLNGADSIQNSPFHHAGLGLPQPYTQTQGQSSFLSDSNSTHQIGNPLSQHSSNMKMNLGLTPSNKALGASFDNLMNNFKMLAPSPSSNNIASKNTRVSLSSAFSDFKDAANRTNNGTTNASTFGAKLNPESPTKYMPRIKTLNDFSARNRQDSQSSLALTPLNQNSFPNANEYQGQGASCFGEAAMMSQFRAPQPGGNSVINRQCGLVAESPHGQVRQSNSLFRPSK